MKIQTKNPKLLLAILIIVAILALGFLIIVISDILNIDPHQRIPLLVVLTWFVSLLLFLALVTLYEGIKGIYRREMTLWFVDTPTGEYRGPGTEWMPFNIAKGYYALFWGIIYVIIGMALFVLIGFILFLFLA